MTKVSWASLGLLFMISISGLTIVLFVGLIAVPSVGGLIVLSGLYGSLNTVRTLYRAGTLIVVKCPHCIVDASFPGGPE